jgi:ubiquinone/menaquinone biosynthesis C-methylase UbiE
MFFQKRIAEPKMMEKIELDVFEHASKQSFKRWMVPLVDDAFQKSGIENGIILDAGCGPGLLTKELAERSEKNKIVGIDISPYAIKQAKKNCASLKNASFEVATIHKLPFTKNFFDLVVCKDSLHQFPTNPRGALTEMVRVLKPGGMIYIYDLRRDVPWYLLKRVIPPETVFKKLLYYSARAAYTKKEVGGFLKKARVENIRIATKKITPLMDKKYSKMGIEHQQLKEAFQSRYIATAIKK